MNDAFSPSATSSSFIFVRYMSIKWRSCDASYVWISLSTSSWNPLFAFQFLYFIPNSISNYLEITLKNEYSFIDDFSISSYSEVFGNNFATHSIILNNLPKLSPCLWNCNAWSEALRKQKIENDLSNRMWWISWTYSYNPRSSLLPRRWLNKTAVKQLAKNGDKPSGTSKQPSFT